MYVPRYIFMLKLIVIFLYGNVRIQSHLWRKRIRMEKNLVMFLLPSLKETYCNVTYLMRTILFLRLALQIDLYTVFSFFESPYYCNNSSYSLRLV